MKKPNQHQPWMISLAAALDLCAFVFMAASNSGKALLYLFGACELVLILSAIGAWKRYFEALIDYRLRELQGSDKDIQPVGARDG